MQPSCDWQRQASAGRKSIARWGEHHTAPLRATKGSRRAARPSPRKRYDDGDHSVTAAAAAFLRLSVCLSARLFLTGSLVRLLVCWFNGFLVQWLVGSMVGWFNGLLVDASPKFHVCVQDAIILKRRGAGLSYAKINEELGKGAARIRQRCLALTPQQPVQVPPPA